MPKKSRWVDFKRRGRAQTNFFSLYWSDFKNVQICSYAVFFGTPSWEILHKMFISPLKHIQKIRWVNFKNTKKIIWCMNCFFFWLWKYAKRSRWVNSKCRRKTFKNIIGCLNCFFFWLWKICQKIKVSEF